MNQIRYEVSERIKHEVEMGEELIRIQKEACRDIANNMFKIRYQINFPRK